MGFVSRPVRHLWPVTLDSGSFSGGAGTAQPRRVPAQEDLWEVTSPF